MLHFNRRHFFLLLHVRLNFCNHGGTLFCFALEFLVELAKGALLTVKSGLERREAVAPHRVELLVHMLLDPRRDELVYSVRVALHLTLDHLVHLGGVDAVGQIDREFLALATAADANMRTAIEPSPIHALSLIIETKGRPSAVQAVVAAMLKWRLLAADGPLPFRAKL